jgi:kynureninase
MTDINDRIYTWLNKAKAWDDQDSLKPFRERFYLQEGQIYMDGNSLGLLSVDAEKALLDTLDEWKRLGIEGWTEGNPSWFHLSEELGRLSAPLFGAEPDEVVVTGSTTVNLHQLVATFYKPEGKRTKILADELTFPSDIYALQSQIRLQGLDPDEHLIRVPSRDGRMIAEEDLVAAMTDEVALVVLPSVLYRSGQLLDIALLTKEAHSRGILIGFDCCHSAGITPHQFDEWQVDFAYWCNYKYLNSGPGGPGALYVNRNHFGTLPGLTGWFGSDKQKQFDMSHTFTPAESAGAWQIGTPHILSLAPLKGSLSLFAEVGIGAIREKSLKQTRFLMESIEELLAEHSFTIGNPRKDAKRGGHVALEHEEAIRICKALKKRGVIPDFRFPNIIRLAPVPFYTSYEDVVRSVLHLKEIMEHREYELFENQRGVIA